MWPKQIAAILALLALTLSASPAYADSVVSICDERHLYAAVFHGGSVTFDCSGTIVLTHYIPISANVTIDGSGQTVTISGNHVAGVFQVRSLGTLNLNNLTIANGNASDGGGIDIWGGGTVAVSNCTFSGNGGAIQNDHGNLTVTNSVFTGNASPASGGGLYSDGGTVTVNNTTFTGNSGAYGGGAISVVGTDCTLTVRNSTFSGNHGSSFTNGGGAIQNGGGAVVVSNSTFSDNTQAENGAGAIYSLNSPSQVTVINSTFWGESIATSTPIIRNSGDTLTLRNTIVARALGGTNCAGTITDGGGNLSYPDTTCPGINSDPVLAPLHNNGGPTYTMALGPGSVAVDAGNDAICAAPPVNDLDQRGFARPSGLHCDIGAYELFQPTDYLYLPMIRR